MKSSLPLDAAFLEFHRPRIEPLLRRFAESGTLHPTLLFTGPEGVGKKSLVQHLLQSLFCDQSVQEPCGICRSCKQALLGQWTDCTWLDPEAAEDSGRIGTHKIQPFRELKSKLGLGPVQEPRRAVVIADADRMTEAAANSILKMLEEPPAEWVFILTASDATRLLPTILSRCVEIRLSPLPPERIFSILKSRKGLEFQSIRGTIASRSANGSLTRALTYLGDEAWDLREQFLGLLSSPSHEFIRLVESMAKTQARTHLALDLLESMFSDLLLASVQGDAHLWVHEDQKELLLQVAERHGLTPGRLARLLEVVAEKRKFAERSLNGKLLAQEILIPVLEVL